MNIDKKFSQIKNAAELSLQEAQHFSDILTEYFRSDRSERFGQYEQDLTKKLPQMFGFLEFNNLIEFAHRYFMFCRTINPKENTDSKQKKISSDVLSPFSKRLKLILEDQKLLPLDYKPKAKNVILQTRHAQTEGAYAPGKQIFALSKALIKNGCKVKVISHGDVDNQFKNLMRIDPNFHVTHKRDLTPFEKLLELRAEATHFEPSGIFTDEELGVLTAAELIGLPSKCFLLSAGFYRTPWYTKILLTEELMTDELRKDKRFHEIPQALVLENLAPPVEESKVFDAKNKLRLEKKFILASFARYEMFSEDYLHFVNDVLEAIDNSIFILAGHNDQTVAKRILKKHDSNGRVRILGPSNISILGHVCDVFLDTFPTTTGYAALESFAKGKPVFTLECDNLGNYRKNRLEELIFKDKSNLVHHLARAANDADYYNTIKLSSLNFIKKVENLEGLANALMSEISF